MKKRRVIPTILSIFTVVLMAAVMFPIPAMAEGDAGVIADFETPVTTITVDAGTEMADITLPDTLAATMEGGEVQDIPVLSWDDGGLYDPFVAGTYTFTADIGTTYTFADAHPVALVTVDAPMLRAPSAIIPSDYIYDNTTEFVVGGHNPAPFVRDMKFTLFRGGWTDRRILNGQLYYKDPGYNFSQGWTEGEYYGNYYRPGNTYNEASWSINVNGVTYILISPGDSLHTHQTFRGYKYSEDGKSTLSLAFHLGDTVGVVYLHFTILPGSSVMEQSWEYVSLGNTQQTVLMSHGADVYYAGQDYSYITSEPGSPVASCFRDPEMPAMFMYVNEITTAVPAAANSRWGNMGGTTGYTLLRAVREGRLFTADHARTKTDGVIDSAMGIQWQHTVAPGGFAAGSGGTSFGEPKGLQIGDGNAKFRNPHIEDPTKETNHLAVKFPGPTITVPANGWTFSGVPDGMTVAAPSSVTFSGWFTWVTMTYTADLTVEPKTYDITCSFTHNGQTYKLTDHITVERDKHTITPSVVDKNNVAVPAAIEFDPAIATAPVPGDNLYRYYDNEFEWAVNAGYEIKDIKVNGISLTAAEVAAAKLARKLAFPQMSDNKNVVFIVEEQTFTLQDLTISKLVTGDYADKTEIFSFIIYLPGNGDPDVVKSYTYTGGTIAGTGATAPVGGTLSLTNDTYAFFSLKHGQTITIKDVPSDGSIRIVESPVTGYNAYYTDSKTQTVVKSFDTGTLVMGEANRRFDFENKRDAITPTGIVTGGNGIPLLSVLVLTIALGGFLATGAYRRKKDRERRRRHRKGVH